MKMKNVKEVKEGLLGMGEIEGIEGQNKLLSEQLRMKLRQQGLILHFFV